MSVVGAQVTSDEHVIKSVINAVCRCRAFEMSWRSPCMRLMHALLWRKATTRSSTSARRSSRCFMPSQEAARVTMHSSSWRTEFSTTYSPKIHSVPKQAAWYNCPVMFSYSQIIKVGHRIVSCALVGPVAYLYNIYVCWFDMWHTTCYSTLDNYQSLQICYWCMFLHINRLTDFFKTPYFVFTKIWRVLACFVRIFNSDVRIVFFHFESNRILDYYSKFRIESNSFCRSQK